MSKKTLNAAQVINELKGESVFFKADAQVEKTPPFLRETPSHLEEKPTSEVPNFRSSEHTKLPTSELTDIPTYELRNYSNLWRLDIRLTLDQKRFLTELEDRIRADMPEGEANNPNSKRITKNSIVRVFIEIFRHLNLDFDGTRFMNENDFLQAIYKSLLANLTNSRTSEVTE